MSGLDTFLVLDGHDRLAAALAEHGRPHVLALARELPDQWATRYAQPLISHHEEHVTRPGTGTRRMPPTRRNPDPGGRQAAGAAVARAGHHPGPDLRLAPARRRIRLGRTRPGTRPRLAPGHRKLTRRTAPGLRTLAP